MSLKENVFEEIRKKENKIFASTCDKKENLFANYLFEKITLYLRKKNLRRIGKFRGELRNFEVN